MLDNKAISGGTMTLSTYEPPALEIWLTRTLGLTVLSPYYRGFVRGLALRGDERVLDFGAGSGMLSRHIAARLQKSDGYLECVDVSHGWMTVIRKTLRRYTNVGYHLGHITRLDLPDDAYDVVVIHFVLHEVPALERPAIVGTLARKLKAGGRLVLREPQDEGLTPKELRSLADAVGLETRTLEARKPAFGAVYDASFVR
jgi:ubiquinone/menaquinone biosynthesis C-methylase UbiE